MTFIDNIQQGFEAIRVNKLRAVITCLIIAIGIAALVGILTSIDGMKAAITTTFSRMGSQSFNIRNSTGLNRQGGPQTVVDYKPISYSQAQVFKTEFQFPSRISISRFASSTAKVRFNGKETNPNSAVTGVDENYIFTAGYNIKRGRNITENDVTLGLPVVILGSEIVFNLFGTSTPIGKEVVVDGKRYTVIGELNEKGSSLGRSGGDRVVFMPVSRARQDFIGTNENYLINVAVDDIDELDKALNEAYLFFRRLRGLRVNEADNFAISKSDAMANEAIGNLKMVTGIGTVIAIITLLGAAISLMNIMLVSVTERTREIGLRKSLGASASTIRNQFLTEAIVICQVGGFGGIVLGIILGNSVGAALGSGFIIPWQWMITAVLVCMLVGLAAGIYPANRAASMDPIEALRHE